MVCIEINAADLTQILSCYLKRDPIESMYLYRREKNTQTKKSNEIDTMDNLMSNEAETRFDCTKYI